MDAKEEGGFPEDVGCCKAKIVQKAMFAFFVLGITASFSSAPVLAVGEVCASNPQCTAPEICDQLLLECQTCQSIPQPSNLVSWWPLDATSAQQPDSISGLKLWLKADDLSGSDGTLIGTWSDVSGNSNTATQSTASFQPL